MDPSSPEPGAGLGAELSDDALVGLYRGGVGDFAFAELVRRHQIAIFRLLLTLLGNPDDAERACEQVFFDAARRLDELGPGQPFFGFMAQLSRAYCQKLEETRRSHTQSKQRAKPKNARAAVKRQVQDILRGLGSDERVALVLADLEGQSFAAIAETLGSTELEAEALVKRTREKFVDALTEGTDEVEISLGPEVTDEPTLREGVLLGGRYRIQSLLGKGGMGAVYRATDLETQRPVALKTLLPAADKDPTLRRRFEREAELIRRLDHPNFVRFIEYGGHEGEPAYVVMEYIDGELLSRALKFASAFPPQRALHVVRHVLVGLGYAHEHGVVHRDIKPDNVMLVQESMDRDFAKILDLGIARALLPADLERTQLTQKDEIFGTPAYMSPEQVRGDGVDGRADLYSLTVMLFELLTAQRPFQAKNSMSVFAMQLASPAPALLDVAPALAVPRRLQELVDRGLAKDPGARFASASEYLTALDTLLAQNWAALPPAVARPEERAPPARQQEAPPVPAVMAQPLPAPDARRSHWPLVLVIALGALAVCFWRACVH